MAVLAPIEDGAPQFTLLKPETPTMEHNTALATVGRDEWDTMREQAQMLVKSGFLPQSIRTAENAVAIILLGRELGLPTMASLNNINVIQNKPTVSPQLMLALINRTGQLEDLKIETGREGATVTMKRKGRAAYTATFGPTEAKAMNLLGKDNYNKQPAVMFQWRAVAQAARVVFPDAVLGLYSPDEMGVDVNPETGEMVGTPPTNGVGMEYRHSERPRGVAEPLTLNAAPAADPSEDHDHLDATITTLHGDVSVLHNSIPDAKPMASLMKMLTVKYKSPDGLASMSADSKRAVIADLIAHRAKLEEQTQEVATA